MKINIVTDPGRISEQVWLDFVRSHPKGNIFQSPFIYKIYRDTGTYRPVTIFLLEGERLAGVLVAVIQQFTGKMFGFLSKRAVIIGGPLIEKDKLDHLTSILNTYIQIVDKEVVYTEIRNVFDTSTESITFRENGFKYEQHLNYLIDLKRDEETLWDNFTKSRKKNVKKAVSSGLKVISVQNRADLEQMNQFSYPIIKRNYLRLGLPVPPLELFSSAISHSDNDCYLVLFAVRDNDLVIGVRYALCFRDTIFGWYSSSYVSRTSKKPNDILAWETFRWGIRNNFEHFDFGGAGKPGKKYGVREFKKSFGGTEVNFGRYTKIHDRYRMFLARSGFQIWKLLNRIIHLFD